ncbi:MAG: 50S ribosomal protein L22 [Bacteroidetes bacterium]|jgi:large subunit ribosomal protein L22|nr:50S ribosomal protein L22 [Bacteroidota bacterium]MBT5527915.1 50S ribosomal protein L22 [Cytophagia bacterium]MBT3424932.1 50S ribosomal protein L22 [Bacteroidota bacterium]MBT4338253.1 50S ribosomal protein L22 [Bacteroidota bacterium]MBT4727785.1 50S ribosomal protein L22 [Bacteroidota bacterium]
MEAIAKLNNCPYSPRKMRLLADIIRGKSVEDALNIVKFHPKKPYGLKLEKLILSAISNYQVKSEEVKIDESNLFVKSITVDNARQLKRIRPAPQGRAHRIRKRSNHVTLIIGSHEAKIETEKIEDNTAE